VHCHVEVLPGPDRFILCKQHAVQKSRVKYFQGGRVKSVERRAITLSSVDILLLTLSVIIISRRIAVFTILFRGIIKTKVLSSLIICRNFADRNSIENRTGEYFGN